MIYLIDDTPVQMLEGYLNPSDYADVLKRMESVPLEDVPSLSGASCVLVHSSFGMPLVKNKILEVVDYGGIVPVVLFSDGDNETAQFNGDNFIISVKKTVLYSRLPRFLKQFRKSGMADIRIFSGEAPAEPQKKKNEPIAPNNVFADFFLKITLDLAPEKEESPDAPLIYCMGREGMNAIASKVGGKYIKVNAPFLQAGSDREQDLRIHDFLGSSMKQEARVFILDTDADYALFMKMAMHIRLTDTLPGTSHLAPIIFVSDSPLEKLVKRETYAQIFLTRSSYICRRTEVESQLELVQPIDADSFNADFLDKVNIPAPKGSNHSLANQWGASRLYMIISGDKAGKDAFKDFQDIHKRLYFKYILHRIPSCTIPPDGGLKYQVRGSSGKHILLIDDEADKGWSKTLTCLLPFAIFTKEDVISESVLDYESLTEGARKKIEEGKYDLIILDLRLGGIREDYIVEPEQMSGYKVLQKIKQMNRGTQVIMLTASNKAWNLKTLMNRKSGADGYFVKESPEYEFSDELSAANLRSLIADMERCLEQGYLRDFWSFVRSFDGAESDLAGEVGTQLGIAYEIAARAVAPEDFGYAYLALYQTVEIVTSRLTDWKQDSSDADKKLLYLPGGDYSKELVIPSESEVLWRLKPRALRKVARNGLFPQKEKLAALYLQTWGKEDRGILFLMEQLIEIRNALIHPNNARLFRNVAKISERAFHQSVYFQNGTYIFCSDTFRPLFREAASKELLYADPGKRPVFHKNITTSQLGIKILLACLKEILPLIRK